MEERNQTIVVGVTGGISAYKTCEIVRGLVREGFRVKVVMTEAATRFVAPLTFRTLTNEPVATSLWEDRPGDPVHHVSLAQEADVMVIAPCTANVLAKLAHGEADDMLTTTALATDAPLVLAPAMNERMWTAEVTQDNLAALRSHGVVVVGPGSGELACGDVGIGRLADTGEIVEAAVREAVRSRSMHSVRVLVTAGGTREAIDPVRFVGNRASGKTGFLIAEEAARRGAAVTLIAGPTHLPAPANVQFVPVESAGEMHDAVMALVADIDVLIMTAAVADFRPASIAQHKVKKDGASLALELVPTQDILTSVRDAGGAKIVVGFAAETEHVIENAVAKLKNKELDLVVANDVSAPGLGFDSDQNDVTLITTGKQTKSGVVSKRKVADLVLDEVLEIIRRMKEE